ncbi:hypothetical protein C7N43_37165 [Sphingobacteriales bacterium UPWRP_1]|nr:hypothetical protein BVG80_17715 [Sphingobacteriales bacterium TSM_CSM]PSJ71862.1 hypothetical protein C7N43_37165 [Sphingobacteriales bacterium UPWRP_1]
MKKLSLFFSAAVAALAFLLATTTSCTDKCEQSYTYMAYEPVYLSFAELRQPLTITAGHDLKQPGKIYFKAPYLLINERNQGVHVIDNSNPASPQNVAFIEIPGNIDMAVKNNVLYADSYTDLLAIDISNPANASLLSRTENAFTDIYPVDPNLGIITGYNQVERTDVYDCNQMYPMPYLYNDVAGGGVMTDNSVGGAPETGGSGGATGGTNNAPSNGVGGSMARFTLGSDYLYIVTPYNLQTYQLSNPTQPVLTTTTYLGWNIETIFPFRNHLLIGSQTGMFIYDLVNPASPSYVSQFAHVTSCDPVVAEGNYAYVTLRSGTPCQGFTNELNVLDISTLTNPQLIKTYPMTNPHGLGIDNGTLFICDGDAGLKIYDASDVYTIDQHQLAHYDNINAFDVIPYNQVLLMIGSNGLYQYDYSNLQNITLLSTIPVKP